MSGWRQSSLRFRLLAGILLTLIASWLTQFSLYWNNVVNENTGLRDQELINAAHLMLLLRPTLDSVAPNGTEGLPVETSQGGSGQRVQFQVIDAQDGRLLLKSEEAPGTPYMGAGETGLATRAVLGESWRIYSTQDRRAGIQVLVATPIRVYERQFIDRFRMGSLVTAIMFVCIGGVAWLLVVVTLRPISAISTALRARNGADLSPLRLRGIPTEIAPLIGAFNQQLQRIESVLENERRFLSDAAHELRTPMATLTLYAEAAMQTRDARQRQSLLTSMASATLRGNRVVSQLLDMTRMEAASHQLAFERVEVSSVIGLVMREMWVIHDQNRQRLEVSTSPCFLDANVDLLGILVRNLVDNAIRYSDAGGTIGVSCVCSAGQVVLTVEDDGPGIPPDQRARIFDRFYRIPGTGSHGSGIGLALVERIAAMHGAAIGLDNGASGRGARFTVTFPSSEAPGA